MAAATSSSQTQIKHGFICPQCHKQFRSSELLLSHFEEHTTPKSIKESSADFLSKLSAEFVGLATTRKKQNHIHQQQLVQDVPTADHPTSLTVRQNVSVPCGVTRCHYDEFKRMRRDRLDHRASETNKLIIRLDRLLRVDESERKQAAQDLVVWIDGKNVSRCPNCTSTFNLARRQHHCRLCGMVMCHGCSDFLTYRQARVIVGPVDVGRNGAPEADGSKNDADSESIRLCSYCFDILESRKYSQISQHLKPPIYRLYEQISNQKADIKTAIDLYYQMYSSLTAGDSVHMLRDAQALHVSIAQKAQLLDVTSKKVTILTPEPPDSQLALSLHMSIRRATFQYIKDNLATLPALPTPQEVEQYRHNARRAGSMSPTNAQSVHVREVVVTTGWSPAPTSNNSSLSTRTQNDPAGDDDPLLEQINIVRGYIEQAREAQRYEEVATLAENMRALKEQYKIQHQDKMRQEQQQKRDEDKEGGVSRRDGA